MIVIFWAGVGLSGLFSVDPGCVSYRLYLGLKFAVHLRAPFNGMLFTIFCGISLQQFFQTFKLCIFPKKNGGKNKFQIVKQSVARTFKSCEFPWHNGGKNKIQIGNHSWIFGEFFVFLSENLCENVCEKLCEKVCEKLCEYVRGFFVNFLFRFLCPGCPRQSATKNPQIIHAFFWSDLFCTKKLSQNKKSTKYSQTILGNIYTHNFLHRSFCFNSGCTRIGHPALVTLSVHPFSK